MTSHVAGIVGLLMAEISSSVMRGISPPPIPSLTTAYPYVTVSEISNIETENLEGVTGVQHSVIQTSTWDRNYETAFTLRAVIKDALLGYSGISLALHIQGINHIMDAELYDADRELHQLISRFSVWWEV